MKKFKKKNIFGHNLSIRIKILFSKFRFCMDGRFRLVTIDIKFTFFLASCRV